MHSPQDLSLVPYTSPFQALGYISSVIKMASTMTVQYILSVIESTIISIDSVKNKDDISSLDFVDYLNRVIVGEGLPDPIVSSLGEVLFILRCSRILV